MDRNDFILKVVSEELSQSAGGNDNDFIDSNRKQALAYYLGQQMGNEVEGRSTVVSTDVADAIEWIMPEIMEQITKNNEVVAFDPTGPQDELQADLESKFVYDIMMKHNPGFNTLHQVIKDSLMQKNGFTKTYFEKDLKVDVKRFTGITEDEVAVILDDDRVELMEETGNIDHVLYAELKEQHKAQMEQYSQMARQAVNNPQLAMQMPPAPPEPEAPIVYDIKVKVEHHTPMIRIDPIPPEEFRINRQHNTPDPSEARFTAHVVLKSATDLIKSGVDKKIIDELPKGDSDMDRDRDYRFHMQNETVYPSRDVSIDSSMHLYEVAECYMHIDIDDDGIAEFCKITVAGGDNPTTVLEVEEMDIEHHPFRSYLSIMMSHKFFGISIFDRLKQLQEQKTSLWRNIFDNLYLQNNQKMAIVEGQVNLDDMLVSRPGGIVRQLSPGAVEPIVTPSIGQDAYQMMEYLDQVRAGRVGVNPEGPLNIQDLGDRVGSEGVAQLMTAREAVVGLIIKVIAETGLRPQMYLIRNLAVAHLDTVHNFKHRDVWRAVRPSNWQRRSSTTANIGTGSGNNQAQLIAMEKVIAGQMQVLANPMQTLVDPSNLFNAWRKYCNLAGLKNPEAYFTDPESPKGKKVAEATAKMKEEADRKEEEMRVATLDMQAKISNAELGRSKAEQDNVILDAKLDAITIELDQQKAIAEQYKQGEEIRIDKGELAFKHKELEVERTLKLEEIASRERIAAAQAKAKANQPKSSES